VGLKLIVQAGHAKGGGDMKIGVPDGPLKRELEHLLRSYINEEQWGIQGVVSEAQLDEILPLLLDRLFTNGVPSREEYLEGLRVRVMELFVRHELAGLPLFGCEVTCFKHSVYGAVFQFKELGCYHVGCEVTIIKGAVFAVASAMGTFRLPLEVIQERVNARWSGLYGGQVEIKAPIEWLTSRGFLSSEIEVEDTLYRLTSPSSLFWISEDGIFSFIA